MADMPNTAAAESSPKGGGPDPSWLCCGCIILLFLLGGGLFAGLSNQNKGDTTQGTNYGPISNVTYQKENEDCLKRVLSKEINHHGGVGYGDAKADEIIKNYLSYFNAASQKYGVSPAFLMAIANQESEFTPTTTARDGGMGMMQFMPGTWSTWGVDGNGDGKIDPYNAADAIFGGARYLKYLSEQSYIGQNPSLIAAGYNAGPGAVQKYHGVPPFKVTQKYVIEVPKAFDLLKQCLPDTGSSGTSGPCINGYREPKLFKQANAPWGQQVYGKKCSASQTYYKGGCGPSAAAMAMWSLGFDNVNPQILGDIFWDAGARKSCSGSSHIPISALQSNFKGISGKQTFSWEEVKIALKAGKPVVAYSEHYPFTGRGHYLTLWSYNDGKVGAYDSNYATNRTINGINVGGHKSYYFWDNKTNISTGISGYSNWNFSTSMFKWYVIFSKDNPTACQQSPSTSQTDDSTCSNKTPDKSFLKWVGVKTGDGQSFCVQVKNDSALINSLKSVISKITNFSINEIVGYGGRSYPSSNHPVGCAIDINRAQNPFYGSYNEYIKNADYYKIGSKWAIVLKSRCEPPYNPTSSFDSNGKLKAEYQKYQIPIPIRNLLNTNGWHPIYKKKVDWRDYDSQHFGYSGCSTDYTPINCY